MFSAFDRIEAVSDGGTHKGKKKYNATFFNRSHVAHFMKKLFAQF